MVRRIGLYTHKLCKYFVSFWCSRQHIFKEVHSIYILLGGYDGIKIASRPRIQLVIYSVVEVSLFVVHRAYKRYVTVKHLMNMFIQCELIQSVSVGSKWHIVHCIDSTILKLNILCTVEKEYVVAGVGYSV